MREELASHFVDGLRDTLRACHDTVADCPPLRYVAHYSGGVFNLAVDVLDDDRDSATLRRLGSHLSSIVGGLDRSMQEARTGGLIRTVVHTDRGAIFCDAVVPNEHVVGLAPQRETEAPDLPLTAWPAVRAGDIAMADLATRLRRGISLSSQNPGGWLLDELPGRPAGETDTPPATKIIGTPASELVAACQQAVNPVDLQLITYCVNREVLLVVDQLGHDALGRFFTQVTPAVRRSFYTGLSREIGETVLRLNRAVDTVLGSPLRRVVLDVEQGAVYCYRLGAKEYLVGVTIDQLQVSQADERMAQLVLKLAS